MKTLLKKSILFTLVFVLQSCDKHESRESKYENGEPLEKFSVLQNEAGSFIKDGDYQSWFRNGQMESKGAFQMGLKTGEWSFWLKDGEIGSVENYNRDTLNGSYKKFYKSGQVAQEGLYIMGLYTGEWKYFNDESRLVDHRNYDKNGNLNGSQKSWYDNGIIASEEVYIAGKFDGNIKYWKSDSSLYFDRTFINGIDQELPATYKNAKGETLTLNADNTYKINYYYNDQFSFFSKSKLETETGEFKISPGKLNLIGFRDFSLEWFSDERIIARNIVFTRLK